MSPESRNGVESDGRATARSSAASTVQWVAVLMAGFLGAGFIVLLRTTIHPSASALEVVHVLGFGFFVGACLAAAAIGVMTAAPDPVPHSDAERPPLRRPRLPRMRDWMRRLG